MGLQTVVPTADGRLGKKPERWQSHEETTDFERGNAVFLDY